MHWAGVYLLVESQICQQRHTVDKISTLSVTHVQRQWRHKFVVTEM